MRLSKGTSPIVKHAICQYVPNHLQPVRGKIDFIEQWKSIKEDEKRHPYVNCTDIFNFNPTLLGETGINAQT